MSAFSNLLAELHSLARLPGFSPRLVINGEPDGSCVDFRCPFAGFMEASIWSERWLGKRVSCSYHPRHDDGEPARNMPVAGYWRKVLSGAWDKTYRPLDWTATKAAVVLVAVGTIILAGVHLGPGAMFASAIGYLWILAPIAFAALVLFIWGGLQTTAELYAELNTTTRTTIAELEAAVAGYQKPPPDYEAWRHVDRLTLREAAFLWCDLSPGPSMPPNVHAWFNAFSSAIQRGELPFEYQPRAYVHAETERQSEKKNPTLNTVVARIALQRFAKANDHHPIFLRNV